MPRWQPFDVVGGAYSDDTRPWTVQDTVNYLVVNAERPGGRSNKMLRGVPGLVTFSASMPESSVRGLYVAEGRLFAVVGTTLYRIATDGSAASLGTIPGVGRCVFTHNQISGGNQVVIGNGQSGYVFNTTDDTLTQITDEGFPGFRSVDFADQYIIGVEPFGRYWFHSDLADATSYSTIDRAEAEKAPDRIQQAIATGSDILVLGERTGQFFYNTGEATGTFQNRSGAEMDVGAGSPYTACRLDNTVYWLGNDGSVYRLNGYVPQRISTHALEQAISRCTLSDAYAFTFEDNGHKCYLLTFPDGQTWCFDAATQEWTRRESYGFNRWRVSALVKWGRHWIAGDFINGKLYQLDWRVQQEAGEPLERRRITGVLHDDQNRMIVNAAEFVFDTGMDGLDLEPAPPEPTNATFFAYQFGNLNTGATDYTKVTVGYGQVDNDTGATTTLATLAIDPDNAYTLNVGGQSHIAGDGTRLYCTFASGQTTDASGSIFVLNYAAGALSIAERFKRTVAGRDVQYRSLAYDATNDILWALEYTQESAIPFGVLCYLVALRHDGTGLQVLGSLAVGEGSYWRHMCVHNGRCVVLDASARLQSYTLVGSTITAGAVSAAITGYLQESPDDQLGGSAITSDGSYIHVYTGRDPAFGAPDTIHTFDGTTFAEVWRESGTHNPGRGAIMAGGCRIEKYTTASFDEASIVVTRFDGAAMTAVGTQRATELMGVASNGTWVLSPSYPNVNTSTAQVNGFSGVYQINVDNTLTDVQADFLLQEQHPSANNDGRGMIVFVPEIA